jgi:hypothetical protein
VYSCELDKRVPAIELYPLEEIVGQLGCGYFNNTISYAIAFALWKKVKRLNVFGADFTYTTNMHFGELGRACCEFWLARCLASGMDIAVAPSSPLLDTNIPEKKKLYGYHRLENPPVVYAEAGNLKVTSFSNIEKEEEVVVSIHGREDDVEPVKQAGVQPVEPTSY